MHSRLIIDSAAASKTSRIAHVTQTVCDTVEALDACDTLRPSPEVDANFARLVGTIVETPDAIGQAVLDQPAIHSQIDRIRRLSDHGEHELERAWSARVASSRAPRTELGRFSYLENYRGLVRLEVGMLAATTDHPVSTVAFLGSGPLPISAWLLSQALGATVDAVDRDPMAVSAARHAARSIGARNVRFHHGDAADCDLTGYDVIVLAAMAGTTPAEKASILGRIRTTMNTHAIVLVRSSRHLRTLLYPPAPDESFATFDIVGVVHPVNHIINSVIAARPRRET